MKKRLLAIALCVCTVFSVAGCDKAKKKEENKKYETKYELGQYKGIQVDSSLKTVEQKVLDESLKKELEYHSKDEELKEGVLAKDDRVKITYKSTVEDKDFKSGTGKVITLKDGGFDIKGVVDAIIGKNVGDKLSIDITLPTDYSDKNVAGKVAHFEITIEAKVINVVPEFTDAFVKEKYGYLGLETTADFLEFLEEELYISQIYSEVWDVVMENLKMESYDTDDLAALAKELKEYEEYSVYMTYGIDLKTYLSYLGMDEAEFDEAVEESAKEYMKQEILVDAIAEAEGITISDELYNEKILEYAKAYGFNTVEEFQSNYGDMTREDFEFTIYSELVIELVVDNVEFVDGLGLRNEEESSSGQTSTEGSTGETTTGENTTKKEEETTK